MKTGRVQFGPESLTVTQDERWSSPRTKSIPFPRLLPVSSESLPGHVQLQRSGGGRGLAPGRRPDLRRGARRRGVDVRMQPAHGAARPAARQLRPARVKTDVGLLPRSQRFVTSQLRVTSVMFNEPRNKEYSTTDVHQGLYSKHLTVNNKNQYNLTLK